MKAQEYFAGCVEYFFEVKCRVRHSSGMFDYVADNLCFEPKDFADFAEGLRRMQVDEFLRQLLELELSDGSSTKK